MTRKDPGDFSYLDNLREEDFRTPEGVLDVEGMIVEESVENRVAEGRVSDEVVPVLDGDLAGEDGATPDPDDRRRRTLVQVREELTRQTA